MKTSLTESTYLSHLNASCINESIMRKFIPISLLLNDTQRQIMLARSCVPRSRLWCVQQYNRASRIDRSHTRGLWDEDAKLGTDSAAKRPLALILEDWPTYSFARHLAWAARTVPFRWHAERPRRLACWGSELSINASSMLGVPECWNRC